MESDQHHVHFEAADVLSHDNSMIIKQPEEGKIDIHVGFLQVLHKYEVVASVPSAFLPNSEKIVPSTDTQLSNLFVRILSMSSKPEEPNVVNITFEIAPQKEKLYREKVPLLDARTGDQICIITLHCRVLGKGKGTPMLKNGIRTLEILPDPEETSNNSDWQGF